MIELKGNVFLCESMIKRCCSSILEGLEQCRWLYFIKSRFACSSTIIPVAVLLKLVYLYSVIK
jgi:hypothetical protein